MEKVNFDVIIYKLETSQTSQIEIKTFGKSSIAFFRRLEVIFETKTSQKASVNFESVRGNRIYGYTLGSNDDKITASFIFEDIYFLNTNNEPFLSIKKKKNPFDLSGKKPKLKLIVFDAINNKFYNPINGEFVFGKHKINLFTNPINKPID